LLLPVYYRRVIPVAKSFVSRGDCTGSSVSQAEKWLEHVGDSRSDSVLAPVGISRQFEQNHKWADEIMAGETDQAMITAIQAGNAEAFRELVERHKGLVYHIVFRMIRQSEDREDVCQDIFLRIFKGLPSFRFEAKLSTWIGRIAYHTCLKQLEKKKLPLSDDCLPSRSSIDSCMGEDLLQQIEDLDLLAHIEKEIEQLPPLYQTLLTLFHVDECKISEISGMVSLPEGTVKNYLHRARARIKHGLVENIAREIA
jgi:RNA polymerase sigma-70 factor (ECF subfamily)